MYTIGTVTGSITKGRDFKISVAYNPVTSAYDFCIDGIIKSTTVQLFVLTKEYNSVPFGPLIDMYLNSDLVVEGISRKNYVRPSELPKTLDDLLKPISIIYIDMDEVIVDFKKALVDCNPDYNVNAMYDVASVFGNKEALISEWISNTIKQQGFSNASPLGFYEILMKELVPFWQEKGIQVEILSSLTSNATYQPHIATQKLRWLTNNSCNLKFNFVKGARNKQAYAKPGALLIDDYHRNVTQFISAGGYAILANPEDQESSIIKKLRLMGLTPN